MPKEFTPLAVLVIDDEPLIRWALSDALCEAGHAVVDAPDGAEGLRAVMTAPHAFDVVFLDFRLPDSNDFTLLTAISDLGASERSGADDRVRNAGDRR